MRRIGVASNGGSILSLKNGIWRKMRDFLLLATITYRMVVLYAVRMCKSYAALLAATASGMVTLAVAYRRDLPQTPRCHSPSVRHEPCLFCRRASALLSATLTGARLVRRVALQQLW
jgi:hypothetical protein